MGYGSAATLRGLYDAGPASGKVHGPGMLKKQSKAGIILR